MNLESDWTVYRTRFVVRARQLTDPLNFTDALGREHSGQPGDYLVEIFDGLLSITPRKFFEDIYVPLQADCRASQPRSPVSDTTDPQPERLSPLPVRARGSPLDRRPLDPAARHAALIA